MIDGPEEIEIDRLRLAAGSIAAWIERASSPSRFTLLCRPDRLTKGEMQ